jgi:RNA polymerase sigma factor (sigma-70 family)
MEDVLSVASGPGEQNRRLSEVIERERRRLLNFIRTRVKDDEDAEDILQDVFFELIQAYRLMKPIEQAGAWLFRVARNRIIDRFRKKTAESLSEVPEGQEDTLALEELLPSPDAGPEAAFARRVLLEELDAAIEELPEEQREVFVAHEIDGLSFHQMAERTGVNINTLLSRKRYAVLHLRRRLQAIYEEFTKLRGVEK